MALIKLFSAPKPFNDPHIATIQRNAIRSWSLLPETEVLLMGREEGLEQAARGLGVDYLPDVKRSESGAPLVSSMLRLARENSKEDLLCIINADVILFQDFVEAAKRTVNIMDKFVLLSQRWDYDITTPLAFTDQWETRLRESVREQGKLHSPAGSDFFLFPKSCFTEIPDFAIGRAGWDNWMIYKARHEKWPVIDCTPSVLIVHQNHEYQHLPGGELHYTHPETKENIRLAGGQAAVRYTISDATHRLVDGKLKRPYPSGKRFWRGLELFLRKIFAFLPENKVEAVVRPRRWVKRLHKLINK